MSHPEAEIRRRRVAMETAWVVIVGLLVLSAFVRAVDTRPVPVAVSASRANVGGESQLLLSPETDTDHVTRVLINRLFRFRHRRHAKAIPPEQSQHDNHRSKASSAASSWNDYPRRGGWGGGYGRK